MDKVLIKDLIVRGVIGINDWERETLQDICINIVAYTDTHTAAVSDNIQDCVDYKTLARKVQVHAESAARFTVEALANDLAQLCLEDKKILKVIIRVEKPGAVRFADSVGVEIERIQNG